MSRRCFTLRSVHETRRKGGVSPDRRPKRRSSREDGAAGVAPPHHPGYPSRHDARIPDRIASRQDRRESGRPDNAGPDRPDRRALGPDPLRLGDAARGRGAFDAAGDPGAAWICGRAAGVCRGRHARRGEPFRPRWQRRAASGLCRPHRRGAARRCGRLARRPVLGGDRRWRTLRPRRRRHEGRHRRLRRGLRALAGDERSGRTPNAPGSRC